MAKTRSALSIIKDMMTVEELSLYQETLNIVAKELERDFAKTDKTTITTARRITIPKKITRTILNAVAIAIQEAGSITPPTRGGVCSTITNRSIGGTAAVRGID